MAEGEAVPAGIVNSTKNTFTKKIGPAPFWVWAALGMGVLFVYSRNKRKSAPASAATADNVPQVDGSSWMPSTAFMPQGYVPSTDETNSDEVAIYDNQQWVREASRKMLHTRSDNTVVLQRLNQYVNGGSFSQQDYDAIVAIAEEAFVLVGPPPEPVGALSVLGTAPAVPAPAPGPNMGQPNNVQPGAGEEALRGDVSFTINDFGGSLEAAADHYFGDPHAWYKFRVGNDPSSGWLNPQSYMELATGKLPAGTVLTAGPAGRIRD